MPTPRAGESQPDFMSRCMGDPEARRSFPLQNQRAAFCSSTFQRKGVSMSNDSRTARFLRSMAEFLGKAEDPVELNEPVVGTAITRSVPIAKLDEEQRLVYAVVYEPDVADAHGQRMTADEIRKSCHGFGIRYAHQYGELGTEHARKSHRAEVVPVESYLAPEDFKLGEQAVAKDSWVMATKVFDDELWESVKSGRYTGYSFQGFGNVVEREVAA